MKEDFCNEEKNGKCFTGSSNGDYCIGWNGVLLFAAMIILLFVSAVLLEGRHYLLIGFGGVALVLVLFFGQYERRKPRAREVVLLSTLTALCVVMNEICAHTIPLPMKSRLHTVLSGSPCLYRSAGLPRSRN